MYEPVISLLVEVETETDQEEMEAALRKLAVDDPNFRWDTNPGTGRTTISGMGELHLEIITDRLQREFHIGMTCSRPQVIYHQKEQIVSEPIMRLEVATPPEFLTQVGGDICDKRGRIVGHSDGEKMIVIEAEVPLAELLGYAEVLRSLTHGRATYTMQFDRYEISEAERSRRETR